MKNSQFDGLMLNDGVLGGVVFSVSNERCRLITMTVPLHTFSRQVHKQT